MILPNSNPCQQVDSVTILLFVIDRGAEECMIDSEHSRLPGYVFCICLLTKKTSQELQMLSNVTLNCQVAKIVLNSGSQLSEL